MSCQRAPAKNTKIYTNTNTNTNTKHKYKIHKVVSKRTHPKKTCPGEFMRGLKTELCVLNIRLSETLCLS